MKRFRIFTSDNCTNFGTITEKTPIKAMRHIFTNVKRAAYPNPQFATHVVIDPKGKRTFYVASN